MTIQEKLFSFPSPFILILRPNSSLIIFSYINFRLVELQGFIRIKRYLKTQTSNLWITQRFL